MSDLTELAADLQYAATQGAQHAGASAVHAGAQTTEVGMRIAGRPSVAVSGLGSLTARISPTQRAGVYQEQAPATATGVNLAAVADTMADVAADVGAKAVTG